MFKLSTSLFGLMLVSTLSFSQNPPNTPMPKEIQEALAPKRFIAGIPFDALFESGFCRLPPKNINIPYAVQKNSYEFFLNGKFVKFFPSSTPLIDYSGIQVIQMGKIWWSIPYGSNKSVRIPALNAGEQFSKKIKVSSQTDSIRNESNEEPTYTLKMFWPGISIDRLAQAIISYKSGWRFVTQSEEGAVALAGPEYNVLEESGASVILMTDKDTGATKMIYRCQPR